MKSPIKETPDQIIIDKVEVESLTKRFLAAVKAFLVKIITQPEWDRLGLEKTWRYFLPLIVILGLWVLYYLSFWVAGITLAITGVWLWRSRK
jgi:hypothetical protein